MSYNYIPNNNFNLNNNNINNSNPYNGQPQYDTNKNFINVNITSVPQFTLNLPNTFEPSKNTNRRNLLDEDKDYQKSYKEEKYIEVTKNQKNLRFQQIYGNKIKKAQNYKDKDKYSSNDEVFIGNYINKIKEIYTDKDSYYAFIEQNGVYNFSQCPFCNDPCIFYLDKIMCINKCFMTTVGSNTFNKNYTLSNFMEQYKNYYYPNHLKCNADLITLYVDKESKCAEFLCSKCQNHYLNFDELE